MANVSTIRMPKRTALAGVRKKNRYKNKTASLFYVSGKIVLVGSMLICLLAFIAVNNVILKSEHRVTAAEQENKKLLIENRNLQKEWEYLRSPSRMERLAKHELGLRQPSKEQLIVIK